ncbi:hypothetical protein AWQ22_13265 [Picosynechococcus sp. PCC 7117]|nr:hypothetical protein AWQ22_13265 [Picosynechococcus sp. PCC 7117]
MGRLSVTNANPHHIPVVSSPNPKEFYGSVISREPDCYHGRRKIGGSRKRFALIDGLQFQSSLPNSR